MVLKVCLLRPVYPDIGLNIQQNAGESVFSNGVPDPTSQKNTSRFTNSTDDFFMATVIDEATRVLGLESMECTVSGTISKEHFLFLLITSALKLATPA